MASNLEISILERLERLEEQVIRLSTENAIVNRENTILRQNMAKIVLDNSENTRKLQLLENENEELKNQLELHSLYFHSGGSSVNMNRDIPMFPSTSFDLYLRHVIENVKEKKACETCKKEGKICRMCCTCIYFIDRYKINIHEKRDPSTGSLLSYPHKKDFIWNKQDRNTIICEKVRGKYKNIEDWYSNLF